MLVKTGKKLVKHTGQAHWSNRDPNGGQTMENRRETDGQRSNRGRAGSGPRRGQTLVKPWSNHGQTMVKPWSNTGQTMDGQGSNRGRAGSGPRRGRRRACGGGGRAWLHRQADGQIHGPILVKHWSNQGGTCRPRCGMSRVHMRNRGQIMVV